jgi:hypothetical protein
MWSIEFFAAGSIRLEQATISNAAVYSARYFAMLRGDFTRVSPILLVNPFTLHLSPGKYK